MARAAQQLGMVHLAVPMYERALRCVKFNGFCMVGFQVPRSQRALPECPAVRLLPVSCCWSRVAGTLCTLDWA